MCYITGTLVTLDVNGSVSTNNDYNCSYISNLVSIKSCSVYSHRSSSSLFLDRPKGRMLSILGARSFYASAPKLWNSLPANIQQKTSLSIFFRFNLRHIFLI